jgi:predicted transcriptional regulator
MLLAQEEWLAENRDEIAAAIEAGIADAASGKLIDGDEVRSRMAARKQAWMTDNRVA